MKKMFRRLFTVALVVIVTISAFPLSSSALSGKGFFDDNSIEDEFFGFEYVEKDGVIYLTDANLMTATVYGYEFDEDGQCLVPAELVIPSEINRDGESYTVNGIVFGAFAECPTLRKITLPDTINSVGDRIFENAAYLETVIIPETVEFEDFGSHVFDGTPALASLAENSEDGAIILGKNVLVAYLGSDKTYTVPEEIDIIADYCFFLSGVEEVILNSSVSIIRPYTFASCRNLKKITIPDQVVYIESYAFSNCTSLEKINLGDSLESIGERAFEGTKIKEIYLGDGITDVIGGLAGCTTLGTITVSENNEYYFVDGDALFYRTVDYVEESDELVFNGELFLEHYIPTSTATSYTVPSDVIWIGSYAFSNNKNLEKVTVTSPVEVGDHAFSNSNIKSFDFNKATGISFNAFTGCKNLTSADLSNAEFIDDSAFENCITLASVTFGEDLGYVGSRAFANTALESVSIGGSDNWIGEGTFSNCPKLKRIDFNDGVYFISTAVATRCPELERIYIGQTVEEIEEGAFNDCDNVVFEVIKYSYGCDFVKDNGFDYEIVGKVPFFTRVANFFTDVFFFLFGWLMF